jgi:DNA-binding beta-propeller fold protein YncE
LNAITNPEMRAAIFKIWLDRDYSLYAQITNTDMSLPNWQPSQKFRLYVRKDVISSLWNYGVAPTAAEVVADPYEGKGISLPADFQIGGPGQTEGKFARPRGVAAAADGSIYVADTENHRIQHLDALGNVLQVWGSFAASTETTAAPPSTFNEPWGIAVGPDGSVYVADTWNHRIQKFSPTGEFLTTWGYGISQTEDPLGFYGPRAVAVDGQGRVFVTDTGNKRVVVFDADGVFISQFGTTGMLPGEFDEPVGLAVDNDGILYVADTWNQRIQAFLPASDGTFSPLLQWDVVGWYGELLDNKPYLAVDGNGHIFAVDPEGYRVLEFTTQGAFVRYWGDYGTGMDGFDLPGSVTVATDGTLWVTDVNNSRVLHFTLPTAP